jgi:hypothetical protein
MSIKGKKESVSRIIGSILILISIILEICLNLTVINDPLLNLAFVLITSPVFVFSILLKVEQDFIVKNAKKIVVLLFLKIILVSIVIYNVIYLKFLLFPSSILLLIICWHTSLSLYKNKKIIFVISCIGYFIVSIPISFSSLTLLYINITGLFLKLTVLFGILLIICAELIMKKKGLLNFI